MSDLKRQFAVNPSLTHLDAMVFASSPHVVRDAIQTHRTELDRDPVGYFFGQMPDGSGMRAIALADRLATKAAEYLGLPVTDRHGTEWIAQTTSTTMGLALVANGVVAREGQEVLTSRHDFFATRDSWKRRCDRSALRYREIRLYRDPAALGLDAEILENVKNGIGPDTRVLSLTWVHSDTGVKLPIHQIGEHVQELNERRRFSERVIFCLDAVHGFGVEDVSFEGLNCDFFISGCHKWIFGPRGTGLVCARPESWFRDMTPTIPSFLPIDRAGAINTPGGVQTYECVWALAEAFDFHLKITRPVVQSHTHDLARALKEGLRALGVDVATPMDPSQSAGIVSCPVPSIDAAHGIVEKLRKLGVAVPRPATDSDGRAYLRFSPSLLNDLDDIHTTVDALKKIKKRSGQ